MMEPRPVEGDAVLLCTCGREIRVRWFVDENGQMSFDTGQADIDSSTDLQLVCRLWMSQN